MADQPPSRSERIRVVAGYYAFITAAVSLGVMLPWSSSWLEAGILFAVGVVSAIAYRLLAGKPGPRWNGAAPRNTQLQQSPPAIFRNRDGNDA